MDAEVILSDGRRRSRIHTSAEFVQDDQRSVGGATQDVARFAHFDKECALAFEQAVTGSHSNLMHDDVG
jgi:hypothetical protein